MPEVINIEVIQKLNKDLKAAAKALTPNEARYLVDAYYIIQDYRKALGNQIRAFNEDGEPNELIGWFFKQHQVLENNIKKALDIYTSNHPIGIWLKGITGIGEVISAGLLAHIDIEKAPTAGHIWRFAGLDPKLEWLGKEKATRLVKDVVKGNKEVTEEHLIRLAELSNRNLERLRESAADPDTGKITKKSLIAVLSKRPWNARLKTLCWKVGESFMKVSNKPNDIYGKIYKQRKALEEARNANGEFAKQAAWKLETTNISKNTEAYKWYSQGKLPPAHINERAKRYAVKIFLAHLHEVWYRHHYGEAPPKPYVIEHLGHAHKIEPPGV